MVEETEPLIIDLHLRSIKNKTLFVPLTDPIMILYSVADYIINRLDMSPKLYVRLPGMQSTMLAVKGAAVHPIVIFGAAGLPLMVLRTPPRIGEEAFKLYSYLAKVIVDWAERNEFERIVMIDVKPATSEDSKVYFVTEEKLAEKIAGMGFTPYSGVFTSEASFFLDECLRSRVDAILFIVESKKVKILLDAYRKRSPEAVEKALQSVAEHDEEAVRNAIKTLSKVSGVNIPLDRLPDFIKEVSEALKESIPQLARRARPSTFGIA